MPKETVAQTPTPPHPHQAAVLLGICAQRWGLLQGRGVVTEVSSTNKDQTKADG